MWLQRYKNFNKKYIIYKVIFIRSLKKFRHKVPHGAEVNTALAARLGILAAFALAAAVLAALLVFRRQADDRALLAAAVVLAIGVPFLLPHMHERYFFLADVMAVTVACFGGARRVYLPALIQLASLGGYHAYLMKRYLLPVLWSPMAWCGLLNLAALLLLAWELALRLRLPLPNPEAAY